MTSLPGVLALVAVAALWLLVTALRWRAARRQPGLAPAVQELLVDALGPIEPETLYARLADSLAHSFALERIVIHAASMERGQESWSAVFPAAQPLPPDGDSARALALVARQPGIVGRRHEVRDEDERPIDVGRLLDEAGVDWLLPVPGGPSGPGGGDEALVVGVRLRDGAEASAPRLLEQWRICASAIVQAQALRHGDELDRELVNEAEMAKFLEAAALSPIEGHGQGLEWAVRFVASGGRPYFLTTYAPSATKTLVVFGRAIASGVAASLVNVSIKSCCDVMVKLIGQGVSLPDLTDRLNRFLWQPRKPIGAYCHLLLVDRAAGRLELASAGASTLTRVYTKEGKKAMRRMSCQGLPLGTSIEGTWKVTSSLLRPGDGFLVWTEVPAGGEARGLRPASVLARDEITAEGLIDEALGAEVDTPCLLAVAVH
jgi:hypothetical protein